MIRSLALALAALAITPAVAAADEPAMSVSVTVEVGSAVTAVDFPAEEGADGRIATRVAYRGGRTIAFSAHGMAVRIAVRAAS